jgi:hypothetical protein
MSRPNHPIFDLLRHDAWLQESTALRWALGNDEAAIYAYLLYKNEYWKEHDGLNGGYFFLTIEDLYVGVHVNKRAQRSAVKNLVDNGLIDMKVQGIPPIRYFKINFNQELIIKLLQKGKELAENVRKVNEFNKSAEMHLLLGAETSPTKNISFTKRKKWLNVVNTEAPDILKVVVTEVAP